MSGNSERPIGVGTRAMNLDGLFREEQLTILMRFKNWLKRRFRRNEILEMWGDRIEGLNGDIIAQPYTPVELVQAYLVLKYKERVERDPDMKKIFRLTLEMIKAELDIYRRPPIVG